jgi:hypothetical protein
MQRTHYSCQILMKLDSIQISNFIKIRPVGAELFHARRQTDGCTDIHGEAESRVSQFCERSKNGQHKIRVIASAVDMPLLIYTFALITSASFNV